LACIRGQVCKGYATHLGGGDLASSRIHWMSRMADGAAGGHASACRLEEADMTRLMIPLITVLFLLTASTPAWAHCDTTSGPVATDARAALEAKDPRLVLHWVRAEDEAMIVAAFEQALAARARGPEAAALAERQFLETLVRIHRASEGAPYTGVKDDPPEPVIAATDQALAGGSAAELEQHLVTAVRAGLSERFEAARAARSFKPGDVIAGRRYVASYVALTHWVEGLAGAAEGPAAHHGGEATHEATGHAAATAHDQAGHGGHLEHLPWLLAGLLGVIAVIEAVLLVRRRAPARA
jgi:hypothetical protein